jgi:hypothetical protein
MQGLTSTVPLEPHPQLFLLLVNFSGSLFTITF